MTPTLNYLRTNFERFPLAALEDSRHVDCVRALYRRYLPSLDWENPALEDAIMKMPIEIRTVYKMYLGEDDRVEMRIVVFEGEPLGLVYRKPDEDQTYDEEIFDASGLRKLGRELATCAAEIALARVEEAPGDTLRHMRDSSLSFVTASCTAFVLQAPADALYPDCVLWKSHRAFYTRDDGTLIPVTTFLGSPHKGRTDEVRHQVQVEIDGEESVVDGRRLVFELVSGTIDAHELKAAFTEPGGWFVEVAYTHAPTVFISTSVPHSWFSALATVKFESNAERDRFVEQHPVKTVQSGGPFRLEKLGFKGEVQYT
jgi:hypothetical protein